MLLQLARALRKHGFEHEGPGSSLSYRIKNGNEHSVNKGNNDDSKRHQRQHCHHHRWHLNEEESLSSSCLRSPPLGARKPWVSPRTMTARSPTAVPQRSCSLTSPPGCTEACSCPRPRPHSRTVPLRADLARDATRKKKPFTSHGGRSSNIRQRLFLPSKAIGEKASLSTPNPCVRGK